MKKDTKKPKKPELAKKYQDVLHEQTIDENGPGTIVKDFEILLEFVQKEAPHVSKKNNLLPLKSLRELNSRLTNPLHIDLKRPVQKSYPHINGLYMLLRATGIGYIEGAGSKLFLALDKIVLESWQSLNPTEKYCTLLETWLLRSSPEMIGEHGDGLWNNPLSQWSRFFEGRMKGKTLNVTASKEAGRWLTYTPGLHNLALLELFGFVTIEHGQPDPGKGWKVLTISKTPFGEAMLNVFFSQQVPKGDIIELLFQSLSFPEEDEEEVEDAFGQLQQDLQPYFPEWKNNLTISEPEIQEGTYIFKISLGSIWRRIAISGDMLLEHLSNSILNAFDFDHDHLYCFICKDHYGRELNINHPYIEEPPFTDEIRIQEVPLHVGQSMTFVFDFGDNWEFTVLLERIDPVDPKLNKSKVLESKGEAPEQYPSWDEEW